MKNKIFTKEDMKAAFEAGSNKQNWSKINLSGVISGVDYTLEPIFENWFDFWIKNKK